MDRLKHNMSVFYFPALYDYTFELTVTAFDSYSIYTLNINV